MLPLLERLEVDPGECCCCCCCGVAEGEAATTVVEEDALEDGGAGGGRGRGPEDCAAAAAGAPATMAPPLLTGSCIVTGVGAVPPTLELLAAGGPVVLASTCSFALPRLIFPSASSPFLGVDVYFGVEDPAAPPGGVTEGVFDDGRGDVTADSFLTVLMGSLLDYTF